MRRDRVAMLAAGASIAVVVATAYALWRDGGTGDVWVPVIVVGIHGASNLTWAIRPLLPRRNVIAFGLVELIGGLLLFSTAPILRGRFAAPGQDLASSLQIWGLVGIAVAGSLVTAAGLIHSRSSEMAPR